MVWDTFYGKQPNPYSANQFRLILSALEEKRDRGDSSEALTQLIETTREALATETEDEDDENGCSPY